LADRAQIPHHLIDICNPDEAFDVGDFVSAAAVAVDDIQARGRVPVLSGGTAFYFHNYLLGLPETPVSDPEVRQAAKAKWDDEGEVRFRRSLAAVDPTSEARILPRDAYRLQRAWEVWVQTGRPLSSMGRTPVDRGPVFLAGLDRPRDELYGRIEARVDAMVEAGLEDEVRGLVAAGYGVGTPALKGIGYSEWLPFVMTGEASRQAVRDQIVLDSRHYAKRQLTFFRSLPGVRWYHPDQSAQLQDDLRAWSLTNLPGWW